MYCIYIPSDNEVVACVDRKKVTENHYYIPGMIEQNVLPSSSRVRLGLVVVVAVVVLTVVGVVVVLAALVVLLLVLELLVAVAVAAVEAVGTTVVQ